jgi:hypothetical protein
MVRYRLNGFICAVFSVVVLAAPAAFALPSTTTPACDLDDDGVTSIKDVQCMILVWRALKQQPDIDEIQCTAGQCDAGKQCANGFFGNDLCLPECLSVSAGLDPAVECPVAGSELCTGSNQRKIADTNCDNDITNVDFTFIIATMLQKLGGPGTHDSDDDEVFNGCDDHCFDAPCKSGCESTTTGYTCSECNDGFVLDEDVCLVCDSGCATCTGVGPSDCTTCPSGDAPVDGVCSAEDGAACVENGDCINSCLSGLCASPVTLGGTCDEGDDEDCATGHDCVGTSPPTCLLSAGESCNDASECNGLCVADICQTDSDDDGDPDTTDCAPTDPEVSHSADELCGDEIDNNCDGKVNEICLGHAQLALTAGGIVSTEDGGVIGVSVGESVVGSTETASHQFQFGIGPVSTVDQLP